LDITLGEYASSAGLVSMRVIWDPICASILEGLIDKGLLETKEATNLLDIEPLLVE